MVEARQTRIRYLIISILFAVSCFSFADRSALSQTASAMPKDLNLNAERMGYLLSAFGWAYALGQLPAGGLLDRFGSKRVYGVSIIFWSLFAFLPVTQDIWTRAVFTRFLFSGFSPGWRSRPCSQETGAMVAAWFPPAERGAPPPFSIRRSISRYPSSRRSSDG